MIIRRKTPEQFFQIYDLVKVIRFPKNISK